MWYIHTFNKILFNYYDIIVDCLKVTKIIVSNKIEG